jgi:hypothetical protein
MRDPGDGACSIWDLGFAMLVQRLLGPWCRCISAVLTHAFFKIPQRKQTALLTIKRFEE